MKPKNIGELIGMIVVFTVLLILVVLSLAVTYRLTGWIVG